MSQPSTTTRSNLPDAIGATSQSLDQDQPSPAFADFLIILADQEALAHEIVELTQRERIALLDREVDPLLGIIAEKEVLAARLALAEQRRLAWVAERLATDRPETVTLTDLVDALPTEESRQLNRRRGQFARSILAAAEANRRNGMLTSTILAMVRQLLLRIFGDDGVRYGPPRGRRAAPGVSRTLDLQA